MPRLRTVLLSTATVAIGLTGLVAAPGSASADTPSCQGRAATIIGPTSGRDTVGTPGDDVIVTTAEGFAGPGTITSGDGDDLVCIAPGTAPLPDSRTDAGFLVTTGAGNDSVVVEETRPTSFLTVELGPGDDSFRGNDRNETVYAGQRPGSEGLGADDGRDTIVAAGGEDHVYTGSPLADTSNLDVVSTGDGQDTVVHGGTGTTLDNGAGDGDNLSLVRPRSAQRHVTVDNRTRQASGDAGVFLRWTNVHFVNILVDSPTTFIGSDEDEIVYASSTLPLEERAAAPVDVRMAGGDDVLWFADGPLPGRADGGDGHDALELPLCRDVHYRLDDVFACSRTGTAGLITLPTEVSGWEGRDVVRARQSARVVGTAGPDDVLVVGRRIQVVGRAGRDRLTVSPFVQSGGRASLSGGAGGDRLTGSRSRDALRGGGGPDLLLGRAGQDRLVGGTGRDEARGGRGSDVCAAEVHVGCERQPNSA